MRSTMQDRPLTLDWILRHGRRLHAESEVATWNGERMRRASFAQVAERVERLAAGLRRLGVSPGDRVGTFCWNRQEHLEAYLAVPCMGAVLHTLNIRLFPDQTAYVVNHAGDRVILVEDALAPALAEIQDRLGSVEHFVIVGEGDDAGLRGAVRYEALLAGEEAAFPWPELDERSAAAMCYTSGTTGHPKGVVYGHRSVFLHSLAQCSADAFGIAERDRILLNVPMFHANAWGVPYAGWMAGSDFLLPGPHVQAEALAHLIQSERATFTAGVPTLWNDLLRYGESHPLDLSSLRMIVCGGSAVPGSLIDALRERYGVPMLQGWGMTETSPLCALSHPPKAAEPGEDTEWRVKAGRPVPGVEVRAVTEEGEEVPWDGSTTGELEVRGPWVTGGYYRNPAPEKLHDGWLRSGDVGAIDARGYVRIVDRTKDVVKSGGEWISSVDLENTLMGHPDVVEAAVIGVADPRWSERPLACVVLREGAAAEPDALREWLSDKVARFWVPERWAMLPEIPKTSVGKFDKKELRERHERGALPEKRLARRSK